MLNFVIAIMSDTFANYNQYCQGLYFQELIRKFPEYEWDDKHGWIACAYPPFNAAVPLLMPWVLVREYLGHPVGNLNEVLAHIFYIPCALFVIPIFVVINCLVQPFFYLYQISQQAVAIATAKTRQDTLHLIWTTLLFIVIGPLMLVMSIVIDFVIFIRNLYT